MAKKARKKASRKRPARKSSTRKAPAKKSTAKRKPRAKAAARSNQPITEVGIGKGKVANVGGLTFTYADRDSLYDDMYEGLAGLKPPKGDDPGTAYLVPVPKGVEPSVIHNRLAAAFRRGNVQSKAPKGFKFNKRTSVGKDGATYIAIVLAKSTGE